MEDVRGRGREGGKVREGGKAESFLESPLL